MIPPPAADPDGRQRVRWIGAHLPEPRQAHDRHRARRRASRSCACRSRGSARPSTSWCSSCSPVPSRCDASRRLVARHRVGRRDPADGRPARPPALRHGACWACCTRTGGARRPGAEVARAGLGRRRRARGHRLPRGRQAALRPGDARRATTRGARSSRRASSSWPPPRCSCWPGRRDSSSARSATAARCVAREDVANRERALVEYRYAVEQERNRIARDMHDVVAHSLAVVIAQADGARFAARTRSRGGCAARSTRSPAWPARRSATCGCCSPSSATTRPPAPQPVLDDLDRLLEQRARGRPRRALRRAGRAPRARHGPPDRRVPHRAGGLTNALRHGDVSRAGRPPAALGRRAASSSRWSTRCARMPRRPSRTACGTASPACASARSSPAAASAPTRATTGSFRVRARIPAQGKRPA